MKINKRLGIKNLKIWDNIIESDFSVPYQFVEIFIPHLCLLISKITAHCQNDIVRSVMESLLVRELDKWFHLPHRKTRLRFYNFFFVVTFFSYSTTITIKWTTRVTYYGFKWRLRSDYRVSFIAYSGVDVVVRAVGIIDHRLVGAKNVETETRRWRIVVVKRARK